jgi:glutathione transport system permease protein
MRRALSRKIAALPLVLIGVAFIVFGAIRLLPGDPARMMAGPQADQESVDRMRERLGLDAPFLAQFGEFLVHAVRGDFGTSIRSKRPVTRDIADRLPYTLALAGCAYLLAIFVGTLAGVGAAIGQGRWPDHLVMAATIAFTSMAGFWVALMGMEIFSVTLRWLPLLGAGSVSHYVMPTIVLALQPLALIARMTRSSMLDVIGQDFVRTARAVGLSEWVVVFRHALRNALIPVVTIVALNFGGLVAGAVVTETVFDWPGIGRMLVDAVRYRDYPVIQGVVLLAVAGVVVINTAADVLIAAIDPRIRFD